MRATMVSTGKSVRWRRLAGVVVPVLLAFAMTEWVAPPANAATSGNLIVDGDGSAALCSSSGYEDTSIPGWTITSGAPNVTCYNNTGGFPTASTTGAQPGPGLFTGGTHGNASMTQTVDVSAAASAIDTGTATYDLSGWLGGFGGQNDRADVVATFLDATGGSARSPRHNARTRRSSCPAPRPAPSRPAPAPSGWTSTTSGPPAAPPTATPNTSR